jgi:hypothetical protein
MAVVVHIPDAFKEYVADGTIDLDDATAGAFKCLLLTSSYASFNAAHGTYADVSANEHSATSTGYTTGGAALTGISWAQTSGTAKFNADDVSWTAGTNGLNARWGVVYYAAAASDPIVCFVDFDDTPGTKSVSSGGTLQIQWDNVNNAVFSLA